uniref:Coatomer subunit delta n=1 Tax=Trypanosoma congolense (strain IL3000) TaxID=1068625 RepID=G0USC5_TRYCI|nr:putative coatomer delta subunit [Trypanosoma congolense IL3000]
MTVIAAGIVNKQGNIVLSRHFNDISRIRIEGLLSAFPRLLESSVNKQVTYIDADSVRYVYQPLEELFLVLITTRSSNIVEDLATLHLMGRLIPEYVRTLKEEDLQKKAFQVFSALDEVIVGGRRENTTVQEIQTYLEMHSHEEMLVREEKRLQMEKAKKDASRKAHELRDKRQRGLNPYSGISSDDPGRIGFGATSAPVVNTGAFVGSDRNSQSDHHNLPATLRAPNDASSSRKQGRGGGLTLGLAKKSDITSRVLREAGLPATSPSAEPSDPAQVTVRDAGATKSVAEFEGGMEGIHVIVEEKISGTLDRDGEGGSVDIRGELSVLVNDPQLASVKLALSPMSNDFSFRAHTKVHKEIFAEDRVLTMCENKPLPVQQPVTILRWRLNNASVARPPLSISCWPSKGSITVEYELSNDEVAEQGLRDVRITLPLYGLSAEDAESSVGSCNVQGNFVVWHIPQVSRHENAGGNCEVVLADADKAAADSNKVFFPVDVTFTARVSAAHVSVLEVVKVENGTPVKFSQVTQLIAEGYQVC